RPHCCSVMCAWTARLIRKAPRRCTLMTASQSSSVILNSMLSRITPALLTSTTGGPSSSATRATAAFTASVSATLAPIARPRRPRARRGEGVEQLLRAVARRGQLSDEKARQLVPGNLVLPGAVGPQLRGERLTQLRGPRHRGEKLQHLGTLPGQRRHPLAEREPGVDPPGQLGLPFELALAGRRVQGLHV